MIIKLTVLSWKWEMIERGVRGKEKKKEGFPIFFSSV